MNDFITLECPNCGGKLEISQNTLSLKCQYCGVEHIVRIEAGGILSETFARCPVCKKNDKSQTVSAKVSAVLNGQSSLIVDKLDSPVAPAKPGEPLGFGGWWLLLWAPISYIPVLLIGLPILIYWGLSTFLKTIGIQALDNFYYEYIGTYGPLFIIVIILAIVFFIFLEFIVWRWFIRLSKALKNKRMASQPYQRLLTDYNAKYSKWKIATTYWKRLYYCERNGIVYDPDTGAYCDPDQFKDFIYKNIDANRLPNS